LCSAITRIDGDPVFARAAHMTADWVLREMQSPEGGYYSSLDADSEGHEGKYYVWTREEIVSALPEQDYPLFARRFGLDRAPNFEGQWHLHAYEAVDRLAQEFRLTPEAAAAKLETCRGKLFTLREQRIRPGRDDKILTSWNALMIQGMAAAARYLGREDCLRSAQRAVDFIRGGLWRDDRLLATYKDGKAHLPAYLDDYALLLDALLDLLQVEWRSEDLFFAQQLADALLNHFEDRKRGGFFFTAHDHEKLLARMKNLADEALPAGNGVAVRALNRLGWLLTEPRYLDAAERTLHLAWPVMNSHPLAYPTLLMGLQETLQPPEILILRGTPTKLAEWQTALTRSYTPERLVFAIPDDASGLPSALADKKPTGEIVAYRCQGEQCSAPISRLEDLQSSE
ncbi:MAG: thioredoxin domain-containing protein, partial [Nevskiales bacterium]